MDPQLAALGTEPSSSRHRTLAEKAFETLHHAIMGGRLSPGLRLPIEDLAAALEMSPMPIREALRRLDSAGLVENIPHRGARVTQLTVEDLAEVYEARVALEVLAVRRAAERFSAADEARCRERLTALYGTSEDHSDAYSTKHLAFHFSLYEAAGSNWLLRLIRPVWESSERYYLVLQQRLQPVHRRHEHGELIDACAARDPALAELRIRQHLTDTANYIAAEMGGRLLFDADGELITSVEAPEPIAD
jgi:DNA-binding GntR family transcriptional regulator